MNNWKTTLGGALSAVGVYLATSQTGWLQVIGQILSIIGTVALGYNAMDKG